MKDKIKSLYNWYVEDGQYNGSEDEFRKSFFAPGQKGYEYRKSVFDHFRDMGDDVGANYEDFAGRIGLRPKSSVVQKPKTSVSSSPAPSSTPTAPSATKVQDKSSITTASTAQASYNHAPSSAKPSAKPEPAESESNKESLFGKIRNKVNDVVEDPKAQLAAIRGLGNALMTAGNVNPAMALLGYGINDVAPNFTTKKEVVRDDEFEAKEKDYREKKAILEKEHSEAKAAREKELEEAEKAISAPIFGPGQMFYNEAARSHISRNSKDVEKTSRKALQTLEEAHIERNQKSTEGFVGAMGRRLKDFGEDIKEGDMSLFDYGASDAKSYANVLSIVRKVNNGEELTPEEMKVMHVRALQQAVEDGHGDDIGYGYKAMGVTIESLPFMLEMAINPLSGFGKGMAKTAAGRLVKKGVSTAVNRTLGGYVGKKASVTAGRIATRVVGDAIGAAGMAATSGAARVAGDAERRMAGDVTYENADNGDVVYTGNVNQASAGTALAKAFGSVAIENHSEMLGDYFSPILGAVSRKAGKVLDKVEATGVGKKIHLSDARKFINDVKSSDMAKLIDDFQEQTHWDGVIGEYAEEVVGGIENALLVGDDKLTTDEGGVFNLERNIETFLGVGLMGGFMSAVKTAGYRTPHYRQMQDLKRQARDIENSVQNKEAWHEIRAGIDNESDEDTKAAITAALTDPSFSKDERRSILDYAKKSYQLRGSVAATASETEEKAAAGVADAQDDYNEGRTVAQSASPIDLYNAQREYDTAYEMMAVQLGDRMAEQVRGMKEEDLTSYVGEATKENGWSEEDIFALNQYASAKARLDGINDSVSERVSERVEEAKSELGRRTGDDGNVTSVTLKVGDRKVYVTGGNLVTFDDGSINAQESSDEITVYDPATGKTEMLSPRDILSIDSTVNADEELASASAAVEEEVSGPVRQGMEGGIDITTGTAVPSMNGVITVGEEVLDENGAQTGTYNVEVNGEAAVMSEDEMRSAYEELKSRVDEERAVAAERGRSEREAARNEEEYRQQVGVGDDVTFVRDGKRISGRAVMDYDEDSLIVDVEEGARTRSYNVRREEIVAPGTAVGEDTPVVDDNAVQEDDVQTDTGYAPAKEQEETETPSTPEKNGAEETAAPAPADNGTTTSAPSTDEVAVGQETAAPAQAPAHAVQSEQQQQGPANGNVETPAADTDTVQRGSGNAPANGTATAANTHSSAQDIVSDKNTTMPINEDTGEPDYARATPERTREFLYNELGLETDEADAYVGNNAEQAREELEKAKNSKPKMEKGKTLTQFLSEKAAWQQQMDEAQRNVDYWEGVKNAGQETATGMAPAQDTTNGAAPVGTGTDVQNMGQTAAAVNAVDAGEQSAAPSRKSLGVDAGNTQDITEDTANTASEETMSGEESNAQESSQRNGRKSVNAKNDIINEEQKKMLDSIGRALGIRVELVDGLGANGEWDPATRTIRIDAELAGRSVDSAIGTIVGHELTHAIKQASQAHPEMWNAYVHLVKSILGNKYQKYFDSYKETYTQKYRDGELDEEPTDDYIDEEVCSQFAGLAFVNGKEADIRRAIDSASASGMSCQDVVRKIADYIRALFESVKDIVGASQKTKLENARKVWDSMLEYAVAADGDINSMSDAVYNDGSAIDAKKFSISTEAGLMEAINNFAEGKEAARLNWARGNVKAIAEEVSSVISGVHDMIKGDKQYDEWSKKNPTVRVDWRDGVEKPVVSWVRENIEYKYDMSADTFCINNESLESILASPAMVDIMLGMSKKFSSDDYLRLYETLRDMGFVVPCKGCFDAAARFKMLPSVSQKFVKIVNDEIDKRNKNREAYDKNVRSMESASKTINGLPTGAKSKKAAIMVGIVGDDLREHISWTQLMSAEGQTKALADWGGIFRAWQRTGAGRPKDKLLPEPYTGQIMSQVSTIIAPYGYKTPSFRDLDVNVGTGLRRNSHSEYRPLLAIDEMQFVRDCWLKKLCVFKYMKELDDVRLFGNFGIKFNMSGFPAFVKGGRAAGLDAEGNYAWAEESVGGREFEYTDTEGKKHYDGHAGLEEAKKYINKDVSLSSVAFSIPHLIKLMTDVPTPSDKSGTFGSIIPFHSSGATTAHLAMQGLGIARANGVGHSFGEAFTDYDKGVTNFEDVQNDRFGKGWRIVAGKKAGQKVKDGHKIEFVNGTVYRNDELGITLYSSPTVYKNTGGNEEVVKGVSGNFITLDSENNSIAHDFNIDYNDKTRELGGKYAYKESADYYIELLRTHGFYPRFDFEVKEDTFLEMCEAANVDPNHPKLGWNGEGHPWNPCDAESYYSLFCDFGMTDPATGEYAPHRPVLDGETDPNAFERALPEDYKDIIADSVSRYTTRTNNEAARVNEAIAEFVKRSIEAKRIKESSAKKILKEHGIDINGKKLSANADEIGMSEFFGEDATPKERAMRDALNDGAEAIEDVGQKIGGARKDKAAEMKKRSAEMLKNSDESLADTISNMPVSKIFDFDFAKLRADGISNEIVSFIKACKDSIPAKPRAASRKARWVRDTFAIYRMCLISFNKWDDVSSLLNGKLSSSKFAQMYDAYMAVGGFDSGLELNGAYISQLGKNAIEFGKDGERISLSGKWYVSGASKYNGIYDTREAAAEALKQYAGTNAVQKGKKQMEFAVYKRTANGVYYITPKGKSDVTLQDGFKSSNEAFEYIQKHGTAMEERYRTLLSDTKIQLGENRERKGRDHRAGRNVGAQEFMDTFGFRGVEFGNWTNQADRASSINRCYDALMDLADVLGVSPKALSLNGTLGMAFGARGGGNFAAHFERDKMVINLTKTKGAGSLAHEWFHALDNYFAKMGGVEYGFATSKEGIRPNIFQIKSSKDAYSYYDRDSNGYISESEYRKRLSEHGVREEMADAWIALTKAIEISDYKKRSDRYATLHNSTYWTLPTELGARAFSKWVEEELSKRNSTNDYLANNPAIFADTADDNAKKFAPYPFDTDSEWMENAFGNLFSTMQQKTDESTGNVVLYHKDDGSVESISLQEASLRDALNDVLTYAGIDVVTDVEEGQRVLDEANGDEVREQKGYYDPRSSISPVRGEWTKEKIVRRLKDLRGAITGYKAAASRIAEFDSAEELADHMFYHGTQFGGGSLKPSILMSDRDIERIGGGGYGDKYWGVSVSRRKDIASRFSSGRSVRIYPIILVKNAKVKEMSNLDDAADLEDYIVDLWKEGVDAVWIGDKNKGEQELCVLNPRAIVNIDTADTYDYFKLGTEENPLHVIDNDGIKKLYDDAVRYVNARRNTPKKPLLPSRFYPGKEGEILGERKSDDVYEREFAEYKRRLDEYNNSEEAKRLNDEEEYARRNIRFFRTTDGHAYGFTVNGKVYIDPRMVNAETPIHEYTHLWATALRERKPKEWQNVVELMKGTDVWYEVVRTYPELKTDDEIADEVLAQYSGRRGAERLRLEMDDVLKSDSGITEKAAAVRAINNVRSALNSFWRSVARMLGLRYTSAEDVADCVLRDMLNLEKPGEMKPNWKMPQRESLDYKSSDDELGYSLWAIKSGINPAKKYLMDFFLFPTEKYRTVFPTPTTEDYFLSTRTDFKTVPTDDVKGTWEEMKNSGKYEYTKSPLSNSEYLVDHETGNIYRMSDHWGPASSCYWTLDGFPGQRYTAETIAKSNIKDFDVWHNKNEKTVPRAFHMREYAREVEQSITNYRDVLANVPMTDGHRARFERGLAMLEDVQQRLEEGGYIPKKEDLMYHKNEETIEDYDLYRTSADIDAEYPNWLEGTTTESGKHSTQVAGTIGTYRKVGQWIKDNLGEGVRVLDASSGMGIGTQALREDGIQIEDVEPYQSEDRKQTNPATYSSYGDIRGKYDFIISNAVLNVIPDDWRRDVLHDMAARMKDGGRLFINTRKSGEEKTIKDKIELDSPQEVLVKRNGKIASYQRFFTPKELKEWVESELGEGFTVEIANEKNSGTKGLAAVVVTKSARKKNGSTSRIKYAVEELSKKLNLDNVEILDDASGLEGKRQKAKGFYNRKTGKITIVLSNATSVSDAVQTLLHEAVAHYGLRKMFGAHFDTFLDNVFRSADENVRKKIAELSRKHGFDIRTATEEYLASLAEDTNFEKENAGWWKKVKALFADMLRNMGFENFGGITLSDNELRYILWRSYSNLSESGKGVFSESEDMAKQNALNVGAFSTEDTADADLYRVGDDAMEEYNRQVNRSFKSKFREAWIDGMMSVKAAMDAISNELSERIEDFENPYLFENQMHGISRVQSEVFQRRYFEPMVRKFNAILNDYDLSEEDLYKYLMAKHGLERNYVFAMRDANSAFEEEKKKDPNTTKSVMDFYKPRDYSGLTSLMEENRVNVAENEAEAYVSVIENMCGRDLDELWDLINSCTKWTLRHSYECGELSRSQYENIRDMFKHYIPLRGWDGTNAQDVYDYIGSKSGTYSGMVKAKGRRSVADNPIAYIGNMAISQIISGNRNRLKQHAYRMAQNHPTSLFTVGEQWYENFGDEKNPKWMVVYPDIKESDTPDVVSQKFDDFYQRMKSLEVQHKAKRKRGHEQIEYPATNSQKHQHIVRCKMNGKEYVLYVNGNPRFAQAINGELARQSALESTETAKFFAGVNRSMANYFTSRNPSFIISNAIRDMQMAMEMMGIKEGAAYQALLGKNMAKLLFPNLKKKGFAMMPDLMKKFEEGTLAARGVERYFKEFMERGGETGFTSLKDVEQMKEDIISLTRHDQQGSLNPVRALRALSETFEYYNRCVEDMSRFAVYMTSRQRGKSVAQSIDDAKNCTLNFNRKGSGAMGNATYRNLQIFVNPAIQALSMLFEAAKKHPFRLTAVLAGHMVAGAVIPVVNVMCMAALGGDPDDYWNLPVWIRRNNIVLWIPGTNGFITIPLPQEFRCFYGLGEAAVSCMMDHGGEHPAMEVMDQFLDLLPINFTGAGGNMLVNLSPTMLQPLMQIYANTDFTGKPIFRENEGNKYEPLFQKAYSGTPSWMVKTSKFINDLTGGDTHEQGWYEKTLFGKWANNPAIVHHLLKGYYGGVYSFISETAGMLTTALGGEIPKMYEIPIVNRFVKDPTERKSAMLPEWYWDIVDERDRYRSEIRRWKDDAKKGDEYAYEKLVEKHHGIEYERYMMRDSYIKQIDEVRKFIKATDDEEEVKMAEEYVRGLSGQLRKLNNLDDEELEKVSRLPSSEFQSLMDMTQKDIRKYLSKMPLSTEEQQ